VEDRVDKPLSLYAATKRYNELMCHTYHHLFGLRCTGLRFFTGYGPWGRPDMALFKFTKAILAGQPIDVYNYGKMRRDFTYITDLVAGILAALDKDLPWEIFNLGNSHTVELLYFIRCLEKELGRKATLNLLPLQPGDVPETVADIQKSREILGFNPSVQIEEGIQHFAAWYKEYCKIL
jgi:UDP-glucuronate 4-epimerase